MWPLRSKNFRNLRANFAAFHRHDLASIQHAAFSCPNPRICACTALLHPGRLIQLLEHPLEHLPDHFRRRTRWPPGSALAAPARADRLAAGRSACARRPEHSPARCALQRGRVPAPTTSPATPLLDAAAAAPRAAVAARALRATAGRRAAARTASPAARARRAALRARRGSASGSASLSPEFLPGMLAPREQPQRPGAQTDAAVALGPRWSASSGTAYRCRDVLRRASSARVLSPPPPRPAPAATPAAGADLGLDLGCDAPDVP